MQVLVYGDCAVNVDPTAYELAVIATTSADTAQAFGIEPRVAMLSYSTGVSGSGPQVVFFSMHRIPRFVKHVLRGWSDVRGLKVQVF